MEEGKEEKLGSNIVNYRSSLPRPYWVHVLTISVKPSWWGKDSGTGKIKHVGPTSGSLVWVAEIVRSWLGLDLVLGSVHVTWPQTWAWRTVHMRKEVQRFGRHKKTWQPHNFGAVRSWPGPSLPSSLLFLYPQNPVSHLLSLMYPCLLSPPSAWKGSFLWTLPWPLFWCWAGVCSAQVD